MMERVPTIDSDISNESVSRVVTPSPTSSLHPYPTPKQSTDIPDAKEQKNPPPPPASYRFGFASFAKLIPRLTTNKQAPSEPTAPAAPASAPSPKTAKKELKKDSLIANDRLGQAEPPYDPHYSSHTAEITFSLPPSPTKSSSRNVGAQHDGADACLNHTTDELWSFSGPASPIPTQASRHTYDEPSSETDLQDHSTVASAQKPKKHPTKTIDTNLANKLYQQQFQQPANAVSILDLDDNTTLSTPSPNLFQASFTPLIPTPTSAVRPPFLPTMVPTPTRPDAPQEQPETSHMDLLSLWDDDEPTPSSVRPWPSTGMNGTNGTQSSTLPQAPTLSQPWRYNGGDSPGFPQVNRGQDKIQASKNTMSAGVNQSFGEFTPMPSRTQGNNHLQQSTNSQHRTSYNGMHTGSHTAKTQQAWWDNKYDLTQQLDLLGSGYQTAMPASKPCHAAVMNVDHHFPAYNNLGMKQTVQPVCQSNDDDEWGDWV